MARPGVTYQDVVNAVNQLKGQEKNITIENVRAVLGTGSISTLNNHLRKWKTAQDETVKISNKENLPQELVSLIKGLWQQVIYQSEQQVVTIEQQYQSSITELEQSLQKYKNNNQRWQQLYNQWLQEKNQLSNEQIMLKEGLELLQKEKQELLSKHNMLTQQLEEKQERINELHRLHQQVQMNLEHYREAAREQRLLDQQQFEQQKLDLQFQLKAQQEQCLVLAEKSTQLQQNLTAIQNAHDALIIKDQELSGLYENTLTRANETEKKANEITQQHQYLVIQYQKTEEKLEMKAQEIIRLQTEIKVLSQGLTKAETQLEDVLAQNKLLSHDKWTISQEKSQLLGQLKQAEKMIQRENA